MTAPSALVLTAPSALVLTARSALGLTAPSALGLTARAALAIGCLAALAGCGASPVTEDRVERAIAPAFANLVHVQLRRMALPDIPVSGLRVAASCYRPGGGHAGTGEWVCTLVWSGPNGATLRDSYDLTIGANACYAATLTASAEAQLGGPTVTAQDGRQIRNLLYAFDGCFDPFAASTPPR